MPKKPLSMYMLYYSEKREEILAEQPKLSMPEVAKICSEQYQKLSDKKKARYEKFLFCFTPLKYKVIEFVTNTF